MPAKRAYGRVNTPGKNTAQTFYGELMLTYLTTHPQPREMCTEMEHYDAMQEALGLTDEEFGQAYIWCLDMGLIEIYLPADVV